ncbi:unnamed protein product [Laminaria digitata]
MFVHIVTIMNTNMRSLSTINMLADVNIDLVTAFLPDAKSMALFARASQRLKSVVYRNIPAAIKAARHKLTKFQRETIGNLGENPGIGHLKALVERKCIVCKKSYKGGIRAPWGIPAHPECTKGLETNVRYLNAGIPTELMPLVRSTIPVNVRGGYSSHHGQYEYETVIPEAIPGVIPENMTLAHFYDAHANEVSAWRERVQAEKSAKQEKRKRAVDEQRVARQKKQKVLNEERRVSIEGIVDTTYLKWMRMVPKSAKKFVSKLSAEDSVAAVAVVNANADLSAETHEILLTPGCTRPCVTELTSAYALVRRLGEEAIILLRRHHCVSTVRAELIARERADQRREAREMLREDKEDKYTPYISCIPNTFRGRQCRCGKTSAKSCAFNMCGGCCPKGACFRHR